MDSHSENKIKVLITDDHSLFRRGVRMGLEKYSDMDVIGEAENGRDLLDKLAYLRPDVITLGIQMPVMDGLQTLPLLKKNFPHIKILMLTMHNDPTIVLRTIELGANSYLTKEAGSLQISEAIRALRHKHFFLTPVLQAAISQQILPGNANAVASSIFSEKEIRILQLLKEETPDTEIGKLLDLSTRTVHAVIEKMKTKACTKSLRDLVEYAVQKKLIQ